MLPDNAHLAQTPPLTYIVGTSENTEDYDVENGLKAGMDEFLPKPLGKAVVEEVLARIADKPKVFSPPAKRKASAEHPLFASTIFATNRGVSEDMAACPTVPALQEAKEHRASSQPQVAVQHAGGVSVKVMVVGILLALVLGWMLGTHKA